VRQLLTVDYARLSYALAGARNNAAGELLWPVQGREPLAQLDAGDLSELSALVRDRLRYYNRVGTIRSSGCGPRWSS
jgi:hypothetical protein